MKQGGRESRQLAIVINKEGKEKRRKKSGREHREKWPQARVLELV